MMVDSFIFPKLVILESVGETTAFSAESMILASARRARVKKLIQRCVFFDLEFGFIQIDFYMLLKKLLK
jgi:hypothetical protein